MRAWAALLVLGLGGLRGASYAEETGASRAGETRLEGRATVEASASGDRTIVVISDLHMGLGFVDEAARAWDPTEDFRWPRALDAFLRCISPDAGEAADPPCASPRGGEAVDLVIAGDFLELWQPPGEIACEGPTRRPDGAARRTNYGCSVGELERLVARVVKAHREELTALAEFAARNGNCVHVVPGNHDAGLLIPSVWAPVGAALGAAGGCVTLADSGTWSSADGYLVSEHGHQIGRDANGYERWPRVTRAFEGIDYLERPWGEHFVQEHFNHEERHDYELIDNLKPKSAGLRYRAADRGILGTVRDFATFLKFNLLDTSWKQKLASLGEDEAQAVAWNKDMGRKLGYKLIAFSLPAVDPLRERLLSSEESWAALREELDILVRDREWLSDPEVQGLCDQLALQKAEEQCAEAQLGAGLEKFLFARRRIVRKHLESVAGNFASLRAYAYGHTHAFEVKWELELPSGAAVNVMNSGAFQRLVDDRGLRAIAAEKGLEPAAVLREVSLEELPACYTFVEVRKYDGVYDSSVQAWIMEESEVRGRFGDPCGPDCPNIGDGCRDEP